MRPSQKRRRRQAQPVRRRSQIPISVGCVLVGAFLALAFVASIFDDASLRHSGIRTAAVAVENVSGTKADHCKVRFTDSAGTARIETVEDHSCGVAVGGAVEVLVDPHDPSDLDFPRDLGWSSTAGDVFVSAIGVALAGYGVWLFRVSPERYSEALWRKRW